MFRATSRGRCAHAFHLGRSQLAMLVRKHLPNILRVGFVLAGVIVCAAYTQGQTWRLSWSDEFDGPAGAALNHDKWTAETGGGGWGNQELEFYTDDVENAHQIGRAS